MMDFERLWKMMDEFMESDMDFDLFEEQFDRHFRDMEQEFYREFFHTLKKTVELCQCMPCCPPPEQVHISLIKAIECTPQKTPRKTVKPRRKKPKN